MTMTCLIGLAVPVCSASLRESEAAWADPASAKPNVAASDAPIAIVVSHAPGLDSISLRTMMDPSACGGTSKRLMAVYDATAAELRRLCVALSAERALPCGRADRCRHGGANPSHIA